MKRTQAPALPDFEIKTDEYSLCSIDGILGAEHIRMVSSAYLIDFLDSVFGDSSFEGLEKVVGSMEIQGVSIPDITTRCVWELEMDGRVEGYMITYAIRRFSSKRLANKITYESEFGISKGVFRHLMWAVGKIPANEFYLAMRAELAAGMARSTTAKDIAEVFRFETLADNSPMLKYLLSREMTNHGKICKRQAAMICKNHAENSQYPT